MTSMRGVSDSCRCIDLLACQLVERLTCRHLKVSIDVLVTNPQGDFARGKFLEPRPRAGDSRARAGRLLQAGPRHRHPRAGSRPSGWARLIHDRVRCLRRAREHGAPPGKTSPPRRRQVSSGSGVRQSKTNPDGAQGRMIGSWARASRVYRERLMSACRHRPSSECDPRRPRRSVSASGCTVVSFSIVSSLSCR